MLAKGRGSVPGSKEPRLCARRSWVLAYQLDLSLNGHATLRGL